jgi:hypothetical protein
MMPSALMRRERALELIWSVNAQWGTISLYTCSREGSCQDGDQQCHFATEPHECRRVRCHTPIKQADV